ncbi:prohibitin family protein [Humidesulfovibrio idahonensis]
MAQEATEATLPNPGKKKILRYPQVIVGFLLTLLLFIYFIPEIFVNVGAGEAGVMWYRFFGGTEVDKVYGEGLHVICPWDKMYIYDVRVQERPREIAVLTKEGLTASLSVSIRFYPEYALLGVLHKKVGPEYVEKIVIPEVDSALRTAIGKLTAEDLYSSRLDIVTRVVSESVEQVANNYIAINDVIIRSITLPALVREAIETKIQQKHLADSFVFRIQAAKQEAQRKTIEAGGLASYNDIVNKSLSDKVLRWEGVQATKALSTSNNAKVVIVGNNKSELPVILGGDK